MSAPANCKLVGRWRIVEADIWDRDYLDLNGPATIPITDHGRGERSAATDGVSRLDVKRTLPVAKTSRRLSLRFDNCAARRRQGDPYPALEVRPA